MNSCMVAHATQKEQDLARAEWFATMDERRKAREEKEKKKAEQEKCVLVSALCKGFR